MRIPSDTVSGLGRGAHDVGLALLLGGNVFGRYAMHPALAEVSDKRERGRVVNRAWRRYGLVNGLGLAAVVGGWLGARPNEAHPRWLSPRERGLARAKDVAVGAVAVTGIAAAVEGVRFAAVEAGGAVSLEDGGTPAPETPPAAARRRRLLNGLARANAVAELGLLLVNASLSQQNFRRPPVRRVLRRRY
jgi:hypothetical protein